MGLISNLLFFLLMGLAYSSHDFYDLLPPNWNKLPDICQAPEGRVPWILHVRQPDYGWKEHTHRANIALAVNGYKSNDTDMRQMELQLEVEITKALLRNTAALIHENDLSLFIHALVATNKNPRNFHGVDLVADLLHRVNNNVGQVHPFLVLTLCNSHAVDFPHLQKIQGLAMHSEQGETRREIELKALTLKALACAADLDQRLNKFSAAMKAATECLISKQEPDGSFGNAYTSALAVQALTAHDSGHSWKKGEALEYLEKEAHTEVNMIKAYYIEMALNAVNVKFIKDLYLGGKIEAPPTPPDIDSHFVQYTIKKDTFPDIYYTITVKVPKEFNFHDVMQLCAKESENFQFDSYLNEDSDPVVYSVSGIPNDAEENLFWRLCVRRDMEHDRHTSTVQTFNLSPVKLKPVEGDEIVFWYRDSDCTE